jgi:hypothetical protein
METIANLKYIFLDKKWWEKHGYCDNVVHSIIDILLLVLASVHYYVDLKKCL